MTRLTVWAAGSLREALREIAGRFRMEYGVDIQTEFGPSGVLRRRIEAGGRPDVFASADMGHPLALKRSGLAGPTALFAHNEMCAFGQAHPDFNTHGLLEYLLKPEVRLGTSTPGDDPSGDFAWEVFRRAETGRSGAFAALSAKAQQLVGGPTNSAPIKGQSPVLDLFERGLIDVFVGYRSSAHAIQRLWPNVAVVDLPPHLAVRTDCGLTVLAGAQPEASRLVLFILGGEGQAILMEAGFQPVFE
jgi:ABC-type molybdate transport system substrate-binding protein